MLLAAGVSPTTKKTRNSPFMFSEEYMGSDFGETPLQNAITGGHLEILNLFIDSIDKDEACKCLSWARNGKIAEAILKTGKTSADVHSNGVCSNSIPLMLR
jgi:hypothetical protein